MAEALLNLQDIRVRYGDLTALQFSSLAVHGGEILAIIGPNGAGKSTMLRLMGLLQQPSEGKVFFRGNLVAHGEGLSIRRRMASVFQEPLLLNASVYENAALGLKLRGLDRRSVDQRIRPWLERLRIAHLADRRARSLSGGEAQRTSLARAMALDPELLLLDEPFSSLDPPAREDLLVDLETILRKSTVTTVFVTHDRDEAFMLADRVAVLIDGRILQLGAAAEVFARPINEEVARFVGVDTKIPGVVEKVRVGLTEVTFNGGNAAVVGDLRPGERVILCLRPEDITLSIPGREDLKSSVRNRLAGKVVKIIPWGSHYRVALECGGTRLIAFILRPSLLESGIQEGGDVVASFKATAVHVIRRN
ncbi:MAG TPA: ABC transporter ATP-binding protein [Candidatus Binatia bacterium]|nr:ABC transporter ATP-binding protein [Candidatus Binatia bacterium]